MRGRPGPALRAETYQPPPGRRTERPKRHGKGKRLWGIPTLVDRVIGKYRRAGVLVGEDLQPTATGVPQGAPVSPLLSHIRLDGLEQDLDRRGHLFARYWDDFLFVGKRQRVGARGKARLPRFLLPHLKLELHETKRTVGPTKACVLLGFPFRSTHLYWSSKAFQDFRRHLRQLTGRRWRVSLAHRIRKPNESIRGRLPDFGLSQYSRPLP